MKHRSRLARRRHARADCPANLQVFCRKNSGNRAPVSVCLCPSMVRRACGHVWRATHGTIAASGTPHAPASRISRQCHTVAATARTDDARDAGRSRGAAAWRGGDVLNVEIRRYVKPALPYCNRGKMRWLRRPLPLENTTERG